MDFGGCRCQALLLVNDAAATDPVCSLSPNRNMVDAILAGVATAPVTPVSPENKSEWLYRVNPT